MSTYYADIPPSGVIDYRDKENAPIDYVTWQRLHQLREYKVVRESVISDFFISTVWTGRGYLINGMFATTVYYLPIKNKWRHCTLHMPVAAHHYSTLQLAEEGHEDVLMNIIIGIYRRTLGFYELIDHYELREQACLLEIYYRDAAAKK